MPITCQQFQQTTPATTTGNSFNLIYIYSIICKLSYMIIVVKTYYFRVMTIIFYVSNANKIIDDGNILLIFVYK
jgi:hypothetical protein